MPPPWVPVARTLVIQAITTFNSVRYVTSCMAAAGSRCSFLCQLRQCLVQRHLLSKPSIISLTKPSTLLYTNRPFIGRSGSGLSWNIDRCQSLFRWVAAPETLR